ncbi:hypothetical protein CcI156_04835 [Frankia sp. CcI156]|nr:hypothetical protein CgIS1_21870 [Frankia sp. CgIS1]ONH28540.1 hypothetical protein CcI156_04835 [Frankia sp. CcI156]
MPRGRLRPLTRGKESCRRIRTEQINRSGFETRLFLFSLITGTETTQISPEDLQVACAVGNPG